jgi:hypothetical protein
LVAAFSAPQAMSIQVESMTTIQLTSSQPTTVTPEYEEAEEMRLVQLPAAPNTGGTIDILVNCVLCKVGLNFFIILLIHIFVSIVGVSF